MANCRSDLERCYHFTKFAVELNEWEAGVAPTDSRNRPDQRLMEEGNWDEANRVKVLLEDKQRAAARRLLATNAGLHSLLLVTLCIYTFKFLSFPCETRKFSISYNYVRNCIIYFMSHI